MSVFSKLLFFSVACLSWMMVNFLNHNPCMLSWPGVFQFGIFLSVALSESRYIFAFGPSSIPCYSFQCCLSFRLFYNDFYVPIFCSKIVLLPSRSVVGISSHLFPLLAGRIFFCCFGMFYFVCIVWSYRDIFLVFLRQYLLIHLFVCSNCATLLFSTQHILAFFFYLSILLVVEAFLFVLAVWFLILVWISVHVL